MPVRLPIGSDFLFNWIKFTHMMVTSVFSLFLLRHFHCVLKGKFIQRNKFFGGKHEMIFLLPFGTRLEKKLDFESS